MTSPQMGRAGGLSARLHARALRGVSTSCELPRLNVDEWADVRHLYVMGRRTMLEHAGLDVARAVEF